SLKTSVGHEHVFVGFLGQGFDGDWYYERRTKACRTPFEPNFLHLNSTPKSRPNLHTIRNDTTGR
ncbi:bub protein kinase, partial [Moniliophthora roreri]